MAHDFDVIIVGGGIAGSALAAALVGTALRVAVVEGGPIARTAPQGSVRVGDFDARVSSLTPASQRLLEDLEAWPLMTQVGVSAYRQMHVWDAEGTGAIDFSALEMQQPCLGHIVENRVTVWALQQVLRGSTNVAFLDNCRVTELVPATDGEIAGSAYQLTLDDGRQMSASLVVAADGALSSIRRFAGFNTREWDYQHVATVTTVATELPHQQTAWQRFLPEGPLAFLPLAGAGGEENLCSIVWSAELDLAERIAAMDDATFCDALGRAFEHRLGRVLQAAPRHSYPLRQRHATSYYKPGLVLIGDAAHSIHPLAGQGINLGLKDVAVLADELKRAVRVGLAPGDPEVLGRFQRRRMADNLAMMAVMDGFKRLFAQRDLRVRWLRNAGMQQLNRIPLVKRRIVRQAMGL